jgi:hypothetical protein
MKIDGKCVLKRNNLWPDLVSINECDHEMINGVEIVKDEIEDKYYFEKLSDFQDCKALIA